MCSQLSANAERKPAGNARPNALVAAIRLVAGGASLSARETSDAFDVMMEGAATPAQVGALLAGLALKGETASEVAGGARALRKAMLPFEATDAATLVDTCGTGGGAFSTFNISTAAALVAAGAGVRIAKHGNRSYSSRCGSADVLEALGVDIQPSATIMQRMLDHAGIVFMFAPAMHPAMRHVAGVRREIGIPTIMNLLGPLANPAGAGRQVVGVANPDSHGSHGWRARGASAPCMRSSCTASPGWTRSRRSDARACSRCATAP